MRIAAFLAAALCASAAAAQTTNDDTASVENWWDRVGAGFFSDGTLLTPRPEFEIRAHWTALSQDDQAAVRARCAEIGGAASAPPASRQEGDEDESPNANAADMADPVPRTDAGTTDTTTSTTGSAGGAEKQTAAGSVAPEPYTGLAGGLEDPRLARICDLIRSL